MVDANTLSVDSFLHRLLQIIRIKKDVLRGSWIKENWVHAIPHVVLLILWWFSYPGAALIKYGSVAFPKITKPNLIEALFLISVPVVVAVLLLINLSKSE